MNRFTDKNMDMDTNYCVIMAGGIGSRFWPISRSNMPKQFIDILHTGTTLLQQTYHRFAKIIPAENIFVVTNEEYRGIVREQLPDIADANILGEPMKRNTAPCIKYANVKIGLRNKEAKVVVTPADHLILDETLFLDNIKAGLDFVAHNDVLLSLGIQPDRPATGYGYIQIDGNAATTDEFVPIKTFTEKPPLEMAKLFLQSGNFLWNAGIFIWRVATIDNAIKDYLPELHNLFDENRDSFNTPNEKEAVNRIYSAAKSISIDFGVMEKAQNVMVLKTDFGWSDLGTWNSLYTLQNKDENGNAVNAGQIVVNNATNNYVNVTDDRKVVIINDLADYIVVDTPSALLICKRENENDIGALLQQAKMLYGEHIR